MTSGEHAERLGPLVRQRRKELKLTQAEVQEAGGPSTATLRLIEGGNHTDFRAGTVEPLERILQWQPGSITAVLSGGKPTEIPRQSAPGSDYGLDNVPTDDLIAEIRVLFAEVRSRLPWIDGIVDKPQHWSQGFRERLGNQLPTVSRREDGDDTNELGGR